MEAREHPHELNRASVDAIARKVTAVRARIARAADRAGRDAADVALIAAAKTQSAAMVCAAVAAGITDIGENYVQEAVAKQTAVAGSVRWHMIGHLQRNKAARAAKIFETIQSVGGAELGQAVSRQGEALGRRIRVLVEVNLGGEPTKSGIEPTVLPELLNTLRQCPGLDVEGLMTIPLPVTTDEARAFFRRLRELGNEFGLAELSMGMTDDFEVAIEEGATMVRVGRAIFGARLK